MHHIKKNNKINKKKFNENYNSYTFIFFKFLLCMNFIE